MLVSGSVLLVALVAAVLSTSAPSGSSVSLAGQKAVGYTLTSYKKDSKPLPYSISGNATKTLYPGASSTIDLSFHNPNSTSITVPSGTITLTISSPRRNCPASSNFDVVHTLTASVTIPGNVTRTLSDLGVPPTDWPVVEMRDTSSTQDACAGMTIYLHYSAGKGSGAPGSQGRHRHVLPQAKHRPRTGPSLSAGSHGRRRGQ
jgi:hypothetical protein